MSTAEETSSPDWHQHAQQQPAASEMSSYFLELSRLLNHIESSSTHYQTLSVDRRATRATIDSSYQRIVSLVYPGYDIGATLTEDFVRRAGNAFKKASHAFSVLASFDERRRYDAILPAMPEPAKQSPETAPPKLASAETEQQRPQPGIENESVSEISVLRTQSKSIYSETGHAAPGDNRRRCQRRELHLPARLTGFGTDRSKWQEIAETVDVSRTGVNIRMRAPVRHGNVLFMTLPLPTKLRTHGYAEPHYSVYALVRRVEPPRNGVRLVGLEFLGERPPAGYLERPWALFRTKRWDGSERRRAPRIKRVEQIRIDYFSDTMELLGSEEARTENVSRTGLRIAVQSAPREFDMVRVTSQARRFEGLATARNRFVARDGVERICVQFIEKDWPV